MGHPLVAAPKRPKRPISEERKAEIRAAGYDTGYGVPPKATQFQKGQSGFPAGRPKGAKSLKTDLVHALDYEVTIQLPDGPQLVTIQRAIVLSMATRAAKGDTRAALVTLKLMEIATPDRLNESLDDVKLDPTEQAIVNKLLADMGLEPDPAALEGSAATTVASGSDATQTTDDDDDWNIL
jgi:hypothetical protein